ncbi:MAG: right-handed parallel beta-helix repeat-containing protein [Dermatophilus congolensis]|nr:right-handed parallel beta-helix repeat-containing protein [Dermatophilus congolensis]
MNRRLATTATLLLSAAGLFGGVGTATAAGGTAAPAQAPTSPTAPAAAACSGVRYANTSNTIYLNAAKDYTLSSIVAACPKIPLVQTDTANKTWALNADLVLQNGARLSLRGSALGGDVNTLRLRSRASNAKTEVSAITVNGGTLNATGVTVTSWDDQAGKADTKADYVTGATQRGRAFVRAVSTRDAAGKTHKSTLNIDRSVFTNLGYYAAESYGVAYKTRFCDRANPAACGADAATGNQTNSTFSNNYMGTYYWGTRNQRFVGNKYVNNVMYGLNGHDAAVGITINRNIASNNGNHGIICSQRCGNISITENRVENNGLKPWTGPNPDAQGPAGQVHGIMLHRGLTNAVVANNVVNNHPNGSGIAIFDQNAATISRNGITGAKYGIRVSVGSTNNKFTGNRVSDSLTNAVFSFSGSDKAQYTNKSGRPSGNVFTGNTFSGVRAGSSSALFKINDSDNFTFSGNTISNNATPVVVTRSKGITFTGNTFPAGQVFQLNGTAASPTSVTISPSKGVKVQRDSNSTATLK